jgi:hypothetical protein
MTYVALVAHCGPDEIRANEELEKQEGVQTRRIRSMSWSATSTTFT